MLDELGGEELDQRIGLIRFQIGEDHRDDLRVLVFDHLREDARILHLDGLDTREVIALVEASDQALSSLGSQRPLQHALNIARCTDADRSLVEHRVDELLENGGNFTLRHVRNARHRQGQQVNFQLGHVLHDLGCRVFPNRQHHDRRLLEVGETVRRIQEDARLA